MIYDGKCPSDADEIKKREVIRALFSLLLLSPGTPMILGGDEYLRTLYGNNNSFSNGADNEYNWMRWAEWEADPARLKMHHFVRDLIAIRKQYNNLHCCPTKMWLYSWFGTDFLLKENLRKPPFARSSEPWHNITQYFTHWQKFFRDMKLTA